MDQKVSAILDTLTSISGKLKDMEKDYGNLIDKINKHPSFCKEKEEYESIKEEIEK
jgi:hypothetical protein